MDDPIRVPRVTEIASSFSVCSEIHEEDFIFEFHTTSSWATNREQIVEYYFKDGHNSANQLNELIRRYHPNAAAADKLSVFEFASGYGCVSRHLKNLDGYRIVSCDIHPQAVRFLQDRIGVEAILSNSDPDKLHVAEKFDVVFALSFFSHMPPVTWGRWVRKLFDIVADGGLLIFTTHGRVGWKAVNRPPLESEGYWFHPISEQKDIPTEEYGTMIVTPFYVFDQLRPAGGASPIFFREALWWGTQDTYIVQKPRPDERPALKLPPPPNRSRRRPHRPRRRRRCARASGRWRLKSAACAPRAPGGSPLRCARSAG